MDQLTSLINEMDNLRTQVIESDLSKFDKSVSNSKQQALNVIQAFQSKINKNLWSVNLFVDIRLLLVAANLNV